MRGQVGQGCRTGIWRKERQMWRSLPALIRFNSVHVDISSQTLTQQEFIDRLKDATAEWTAKGCRGLWITVGKDQCDYLSQLIHLGFDFHHAKPGYVLVNKFLQQGIETNNLPAYANHYVGVAGFVVNNRNEVLVIRENYHARNNITAWKLPGGRSDKGEELSDTAKREVFEETGIESEFVCLLAFRHLHNYRYGCSDFYHVCLMRPLTEEITPCPMEIAECKWMDLHEYEHLDQTSDVNRYFVQCYWELISSGKCVGVKDVRSYDKKSYNKVYSVGNVDPKSQPQTVLPSEHEDPPE